MRKAPFNNTALIYIMAWRRIGDKSLFEPKPARFTDAYMRARGLELNDANTE